MKIEGTIIKVMPTVSGVGSKGTWQKLDFILETEGQYAKKICISLWGRDKIDQYDLQFGMKVTAFIELESREYNGKWYTDVKAWKIEWGAQPRRPEKPEPQQEHTGGSTTDDLPF